MTYPVDDAGNPRVDFVWGNMAMQPNDQRDVITSGPEPLYPANGEGNFGWDATYVYPSEGLYATVEQRLSVGDQSVNHNWDDVSYRTVEVPADNHSTALTNYEGYPAFIQGAPYDDTIPNVTVPNIVGLTAADAAAALAAAGVTQSNNDGSTTTNATALNDGKVYFQSIVGQANATDTVHYGTYHYVAPAPATTGPIAGFNRSSTHFSLNGNEVVMYVLGRTVKPTIGATITVSGTSESDWNQNWTVEDIVNDDSYNTGGTAVKLAYVDHTFTNSTSSSGTWTAI